MEEQTGTAPAGYLTFIWLAWYSTLAALRRNSLLFLASLLLIGSAKYCFNSLNGLIAGVEKDILQGLLQLMLYLALTVVVGLAAAPVAIAVHRLVILNEVSRLKEAVLHHRVWLFAVWLVAIMLFTDLVSLPPLLFGESGSIVLVVMVAVAVTVISLRMALIFPAVATDVPGGTLKARIEASWRLTQGHFWRLFLVSIAAFLPLAIIEMLARGAAGTTSDAAKQWMLAVGFVDAALVIAAVALGAGVASWVYLWALDHPYQPPVLPGRPSPEF